jgi:hypothetical protein
LDGVIHFATLAGPSTGSHCRYQQTVRGDSQRIDLAGQLQLKCQLKFQLSAVSFQRSAGTVRARAAQIAGLRLFQTAARATVYRKGWPNFNRFRGNLRGGFSQANWRRGRNRAARLLSIKDGCPWVPISMPYPHGPRRPPPMSARSPKLSVRQFADLNALRRQLEEMASRKSGAKRTSNERRPVDQQPTLVIRGK